MYIYSQQYPLSAERLHDYGHTLLSTPALADVSERIIASGVLMSLPTAFLAFACVPLALLYEGHGALAAHAALRFGLVFDTGQFLRIVFFMGTVLPGSAEHCLHGTVGAPSTLESAKNRRPSRGCNAPLAARGRFSARLAGRQGACGCLGML